MLLHKTPSSWPSPSTFRHQGKRKRDQTRDREVENNSLDFVRDYVRFVCVCVRESVETIRKKASRVVHLMRRRCRRK